VLDRFHIMAKMSKAIDEVRAKESKELAAKGYEPVLKRTRWLLLKRPENLTEKQERKLAELLQYHLRLGSAPTCSKRTFSSSGTTSRRTGPGSSSTDGVRERCARSSIR
jgi:transposase